MAAPKYIFQNPNDLIQRKTKLMILDFDVTRYHTFDLFRYLLLDHDFFMHIDPTMLPLVKGHKQIAEQVDFYRSTCSNLNPFDNFTHTMGQIKANQLDAYMNAMFSNRAAKITETQLNLSLYPIICSESITTYYVKYKKDPHRTDCIDYTNAKIELVDAMFCPENHAKFIIDNQINSILIGSIDLAILIAKELIAHNYREPLTIMVCNYRYNYIDMQIPMAGNHVMRVMNHPQEITVLSERYQYEFCAIDPYTGLTMNRKMIESDT